MIYRDEDYIVVSDDALIRQNRHVDPDKLNWLISDSSMFHEITNPEGSEKEFSMLKGLRFNLKEDLFEFQYGLRIFVEDTQGDLAYVDFRSKYAMVEIDGFSMVTYAGNCVVLTGWLKHVTVFLDDMKIQEMPK